MHLSLYVVLKAASGEECFWLDPEWGHQRVLVLHAPVTRRWAIARALWHLQQIRISFMSLKGTQC